MFYILLVIWRTFLLVTGSTCSIYGSSKMLNFPGLTTMHCDMLKIHDGFLEKYNDNALTDINYSFRYDLNELTPGRIQLLPDSPTQNGSDSILTFYAALPSGNFIPKHILGTIFVNQQENVLAIESMVQDVDEIFAPPGEREILTTEQRENRVPILIINFPVAKVSVYPKIRFHCVEITKFCNA